MPRVDQTVLDALLEEVRTNGAEVYVTETLPTDRASAVANALHTELVAHAPGSITGNGGITSGTLDDRRYQDGGYTGIELDRIIGTQTPTYVAVTTNLAGNRLLLIADTAGATGLTTGTVIDLGNWNHIVQTPQ